MKILMINTVSTDKNGITNVIINIIENCKDSSVHFDLVSINPPEEIFYNIVNNNGGNIYVIERKLKNAFGYIEKLKNLIKNNSYDIVHIHGNSHTTILELIAAKRAKCKVRIVHAHSTSCNNIKIHNLLTPLFDKLCTHRMACGNGAGEFMHGKHSFLVFNNAIDVNRFAYNCNNRMEIRKLYNMTDKIVIGNVAGFVEVKNQIFLIKMMSELMKIDKRYVLMLIGEGYLLEDIKNKAKILGISDNVIFVGGTNEVHKYLSACDVIMMPSLFEGLPLALIEQQANGLCCIVSDRITYEADKTGNLIFLSIDEGCNKQWIETLQNIDFSIDRQKISNESINKIKMSGYSIEEEVSKLINYYLESVSA